MLFFVCCYPYNDLSNNKNAKKLVEMHNFSGIFLKSRNSQVLSIRDSRVSHFRKSRLLRTLVMDLFQTTRWKLYLFFIWFISVFCCFQTKCPYKYFKNFRPGDHHWDVGNVVKKFSEINWFENPFQTNLINFQPENKLQHSFSNFL